jgi:hypothetical protein
VPGKEPMFLANQLKEALDAAGFIGPPAYGNELVSGVGPGIYIRQNTKDGPIGTAIAAALKNVASTRELMHSVTSYLMERSSCMCRSSPSREPNRSGVSLTAPRGARPAACR